MSGVNRVTLSELFEILSHSRRRFVLNYLERTDGSAMTDVLAEEIAVRERADSSETSGEPAVSDIELALHHTHLPKLDEAGLVTYESSTNRLEAGEQSLWELSVDELLRRERDRMLETTG